MQLSVTALAPCFSKELINQTVYEKATVTLECELSQPNQTVRWLKGVIQVCSSDRITVEADTFIHRLIIRDVTLEDTGTFWCFCDNVGSTCTLEVNELAPEFINTLENHTVTEAATVTLSCQLSKPNKTVQWLRKGNPVLPDERIIVTADEYIHRLTITDVTLEDCGIFRCICDKECTQCTLTVNEAVPFLIKKLENQTKTETDTVMLMCLLSKPNQKVMWTRDEVPIIPDDHITVTVDEYTHQLTIRDVTLEDAGNFRCACGNVSSECKLTVEAAAPCFSKELINQTVYEKATVTLECELSQPNQTVRWLKGVTKVCSSDRITVEADTFIHRLIIRDVTLEDTGTFWCFCDNIGSTCTLEVEERPPEFIKKLENHTIIETLTVTMACELSKSNQAVQWSKDGQPVSTDDRLTITADDYTHQLIIRDLVLEDAGNFLCVCGDVSTQCTLAVKELVPQFIRKLENQSEKEAETATLKCQLSRPTMTVQWIKAGQQIIPDDRIAVTVDRYKHRLVIKDVRMEDAGYYTCVCGNVNTQCILEVEELAPEFIKKLENHTVKETLTVTLACELSKSNKAVQWLKDGQPVSTDDRLTITADDYTHQLIIRDLRLEDAGNFRCVCGDVSTHCTLAVKDPTQRWGELLQANATINESAMSSQVEAGNLPDQTAIQTAFQLHRDGRLSTEIFDSMCNAICERINATSDRLSSVRASYTAHTPEQIIFVAMADGDLTIDPAIVYNVKVCHPDGYSGEGTAITYHDIRETHPVTQQDTEEVTNTIQAHADNLFRNHSNIQMISGCTVKSRGFGTEGAMAVRQVCIVIYVNVKGAIPIHETNFPSTLLNPKTKKMLPVDVREGGMYFLSKASPKAFHQNLKMGCAITTKTKEGSGTLGPIVAKEFTLPCASQYPAVERRIYCITSAHVFFDHSDITHRQLIESIHKEGVYQSETDGICEVLVYQGSDKPFGVIREAAFLPGNEQMAGGLDVALIEITDPNRLPVDGSFPEGNMEAAGFDEDHPMAFNSGSAYNEKSYTEEAVKRNNKEVVKYGSETGYTRGIVDWLGIFVKATEFNAKHKGFSMTMRNQLAVKAIGIDNHFAKAGDSGALVFARHNGDWRDLRAVGIIEGITDNKMVVVTPIWVILDYFKIYSGLVKLNGPIPMDTEANDNKGINGHSKHLDRSLHEMKNQLQHLRQFEENNSSRLDKIEKAMTLNVKEQADYMQNVQMQQVEHGKSISELKQQHDTHAQQQHRAISEVKEQLTNEITSKLDSMMAMMKESLQNK